MDTMKAIYKILETLDRSLDDESFDIDKVKHEAIGISEYKWNRLIGIMKHEGLITGFSEIPIAGQRFSSYKIMDPTITFRGIVYLAENSNSAKIINAAKEIASLL